MSLLPFPGTLTLFILVKHARVLTLVASSIDKQMVDSSIHAAIGFGYRRHSDVAKQRYQFWCKNGGR